MANISLDGFFNEKESKSLSNLDWLVVNPDDYDNLPFDKTPEYISVPKLEQAWTHENDRSSFNLVPNSDFDFNYKTPSNTKESADKEKLKDVNELLKFTKKMMMAGKKDSALRNIIKERTSPEVIKNAFDHLKKLSSEQGLLGHVYIDPSVFSKCTEGAEFVSKRAKTAKYLLAMDKCSGCVFNKQGRCDVYKKHVTSSISYDDNLFSFYSKHFSNLTGKPVRLASKEDLKVAFTFEAEEKTKTAEFKPNLNADTSEDKTLEDKKEEYKKQLSDLQEALSKVSSSKLVKDVATLLMKGYSNHIIQKHIASKYSKEDLEKNKAALASILDKQGILGKVYVDASLLPINLCNKKEAQEFFENHARDVRYILSNCKCTSCGCKVQASKQVVQSLEDIPKEIWDAAFNSYPIDIKNKLSSVYNTNKSKGLRLAYIQKSLIDNSIDKSKPVESFELSKKAADHGYNPTPKQEVYFTPKKVAAALSKGFPFSKIVKTANSLGLSKEDSLRVISSSLNSHVDSLNKYQIDINMEIPGHVKIKKSNKDISLELSKPLEEIHVISYDSSESPVDTMVSDLQLQESKLGEDLFKESKSEDISIEGLDEFTI